MICNFLVSIQNLYNEHKVQNLTWLFQNVHKYQLSVSRTMSQWPMKLKCWIIYIYININFIERNEINVTTKTGGNVTEVLPDTVCIKVQWGTVQHSQSMQLKGQCTLANGKLGSVCAVQAVNAVGPHHTLLPLGGTVLSWQQPSTPGEWSYKWPGQRICESFDPHHAGTLILISSAENL